jgi:hypothetical protein
VSKQINCSQEIGQLSVAANLNGDKIMNASSKIFLVCGFCISFGIYVSGIQKANLSIVDVGQQRSYYTQARMISNAGIYYVMRKMSIPSWYDLNKGVTNTVVFGGDTIRFTVDKNGLSSYEACVTMTTKFNNVIARQRTIIKKSALPTDPVFLYENYSDASGEYSTWKVKQTYFYPYQLTSTEGFL